jgi:hypothetical protein
MRQAASAARARPGPGGPTRSRPGLLALLAAPLPDREDLRTALRERPAEAIPPLLEAIAYHRIDGLAHRALAPLSPEDVDPWLRAALRRRAQRLGAATLAQGLALAEILDTMHRAGLAVTVMRGLRSAELIYADSACRPFEDHDLLLAPEDAAAAGALLRRLGFEEPAPGLHRRGGVIVDLHSDPFGAARRPSRAALLRLPVWALFERARPGWVAGSPALVLSLEDELLLLAVHVVKHSFDRLIRVADLAHLIAAHGRSLCWETLRRRAERSGTLRPLCWALEAAGTLGAAVPAELSCGPSGGLERFLLHRALDLRPVPYSGDVLLALAAPSARQALGFLLEALLPPREAPRDLLRRSAAVPVRGLTLVRQAIREVRRTRTGA